MQGKTVRVFGFVGVIALAILAGALFATGASSDRSGDPREVHLVARNMSFYLAGSDTPNPTLRFKAGEKIRIVLRNEDAGMDHDFVIGQWKVGTKLLEGKGQDTVDFRVPSTRGSESYTCTPHTQMMTGAIVIE